MKLIKDTNLEDQIRRYTQLPHSLIIRNMIKQWIELELLNFNKCLTFLILYCLQGEKTTVLMKMSTNVICIRCFKDKHNTKLFSSYNNIDTGK